jgi:hypothetical protein
MKQRIIILDTPADRGGPAREISANRTRPAHAERIKYLPVPSERGRSAVSLQPDKARGLTERAGSVPLAQKTEYLVTLTLRPSMILASSKAQIVECEVEVRDSNCSPVSGAYVKLLLANTKVLGTVGGPIQVPQYTDTNGRATLLVPVTASTGQYDFNPLPVQTNVIGNGKLLGSAYATLMVKKGETFPSSFAELSDWPSPATVNSLVAEEGQGITNDGSNWYFSLAPRPDVSAYWPYQIVKYPMDDTKLLDDTLSQADMKGGWPKKPKAYYGSITLAALPAGLLQQGYYHAGALCYHDGHLYVPLEAPAKNSSGYQKPRIAVFTADLNFVTSAELPKPSSPPQPTDPPMLTECGWCAICPTNGLLYTSRFSADALEVYVPRLEVDCSGNKTFSLEYHHTQALLDAMGSPRSIRRLQGGACTPNGHLYLASDSDNCEQNICEHSAIHVFSVLTGKLWDKHIPVDVDSSLLGFKQWEEIEGITIVDVAGKNLPFSGQVHLLVLNNRPKQQGVQWEWDRISIKHFGVSAADRKHL